MDISVATAGGYRAKRNDMEIPAWCDGTIKACLNCTLTDDCIVGVMYSELEISDEIERGTRTYKGHSPPGYMRKWRKDHIDSVRRYNQKWRKAHALEMSEYMERYWQENPDRKKAYAREFYKRHKDEISERNKKRYLENREKIRERQKAYREAHKDEINARRRERRAAG